ncbi:GNAT family N-acetyltransferase [Rhodococcus sp. SJ-2]
MESGIPHPSERSPELRLRIVPPKRLEERQYNDLAEVIATEPQNIDVALDLERPMGWICTRLQPEDCIGEVYVLAVDPDYQRRGVSIALL